MPRYLCICRDVSTRFTRSHLFICTIDKIIQDEALYIPTVFSRCTKLNKIQIMSIFILRYGYATNRKFGYLMREVLN